MLVDQTRAVALTYRGIDAAMPWQGLMDQLAPSIASYSATLQVFSPRHPGYYVVTSNRLSYRRPEWLQLAVHLSRDIFPQDHEPRSIDELMSREQYQSTEIYREYLYPERLHYLLVHEVYSDENLCIRIAADRRLEQGPYGEVDKHLLAQLSPHLIEAARLRLRLQDQQARIEMLESSLSNMGVGVLSLGTTGEVLEGNEQAQRLLQQHGQLKVRNQRLCIEAARGRRLRDVLNDFLKQTGGEPPEAVNIHVEGLGNAADLQLVVKPLCKTSVGAVAGTVAKVFINEVGARRPGLDPSRLQEMFSLTDREADLAVLVAEGCSPPEAAERLGVSINTVKTHLRGIYDKLGVRRLAKVATILNSSMVAMV